MSSLLIKNGRIIDPASKMDQVGDVLISDGKIAQVGTNLSLTEGPVLDASGWVIAPGFIDVHVHLREPGREDKETIESGTQAAAAGGFTSVCCMPNTTPVNDSPANTQFIMQRAKDSAVVRVFPIGAITVGSKGERLAEIGEMVEAGAVGISDDGIGVLNGQLMRRAMEYTLPFDIPVIEHCEDKQFVGKGVMNEGPVATRLGLKGISRLAEENMLKRDLLLAELTGAHLHVAHISTRGSLQMVREARQKGIRVTCEATPHHFTLTDAACCGYDTNTKMNPPLRSAEDVAALVEGLADGTVDCIASDHAPHNANDKMLEFDLAPFGIMGLETSVALALTQLVHTGKISLSRMVELFTIKPAQIIHQPLGRLKPGLQADLTLFDPEESWTYDVSLSKSKSRNTPFNGRQLKGRVQAAIVGGKIVCQLSKSK